MRLRRISVPEFGAANVYPVLSSAEYEDRLARLAERMGEEKLDCLVVFGDREHSANIAYLTGYDPRFEDALFVTDCQGNRVLVVGNEGLGYIPAQRPRYDVACFQEFSLPGQDRSRSPTLRKLLSDHGIGRGLVVGCVGWKYFRDGNVENPATAVDIPAYLADAIRELAGDRQLVRNATDLMIDPDRGLRNVNSAAQLAQFEFAAVATSGSLRRAILALREGITERELSRYFWDMGLPHSCHAMISFGEKARQGLASPGDNVARRGDAVTMAFGLWGSLTARAGVIAAGPADLPDSIRDFYDKFVGNYFEVVSAWYESIRVGAVADEVVSAAEKRRDPELFDFAVNSGHTLHIDEWVHSPFFAGSKIVLKSGMALQCDIIPVSKGPFACSNVEDGIALADDALRRELAGRHPDCWKRIVARRTFVKDELGINLDESVLPLGNTPCVLSPYFLSPDECC